MVGLDNVDNEKRDAIERVRHPKKRVMLAAVSNTGHVGKSCTMAEISRETHYNWLKKDPLYREAFNVAWDRAVDALEAEAVRRAFEGVTKPVYHAGKRAVDIKTNEQGDIVRDPITNAPIGVPAVVREYSDTLLIFLLKGKRPSVYRENYSIDNRFVDSQGRDRPFLLADADRLVAEADAEDAVEIKHNPA